MSNGGYAIGDNVGFIYRRLPNAIRSVLTPTDMSAMLRSSDSFAVLRRLATVVRGSDGYTARAETTRSEKRRDYFAAGTLVVWDVDLLGGNVIRVYRSSNPDVPTIYRRGDIAEAEPAVPRWTMPIDGLFK